MIMRADPATSYAHAEELADAFRVLKAHAKKVICSFEDAVPKALYACASSSRSAFAWERPTAIIDSMRQLIVRNVPPEVVTHLKRRAAEHGRSAEAEHREILKQALLGPATAGSLKSLLASMPDVGEDEDFARPRSKRRPVAL